jgi:hypothetical protein
MYVVDIEGLFNKQIENAGQPGPRFFGIESDCLQQKFPDYIKQHVDKGNGQKNKYSSLKKCLHRFFLR